MTIQALSRAIVEAVLATLDRHTFAAIPDTEIQAACHAVAQLIRQESASCVEPDDEEEVSS